MLDDELKLKIRELVLDGATYETIAETIGVPYQTFRSWVARNYQALADALTTYRHERMLRKAEAAIETLVDSEDEKVQLGAATHITETLGKRWFSKRSELTGAEGKPLVIASEIADKYDLGEAKTSSN